MEAMRATRVLHAADQDPFPAPGRTRVITDRQPEGRRRQDDVDGEPRRRAGALRAADAGHRPRPAGQHEHRARRRALRRDAVDLRRPGRRQHPRRGRAPDHGEPEAALRAGDDRPGRRRDRAGLRRRPRVPAAPRDRGATCTRSPRRSGRTTCSSTARRPWGCSRSTRSWPATRCSSRSSASTTRWRGSASCSTTSTWSGSTSTRASPCRTILLTMYDGRTKLADQVADEVRNHFGDLVLSAVIPRNVRVSEAPGYGQSVLTYDPGSRGSTSYVEAARELAERGVDLPPLAARPAPPPRGRRVPRGRRAVLGEPVADSATARHDRSTHAAELRTEHREEDRDEARRTRPGPGRPHPDQLPAPTVEPPPAAPPMPLRPPRRRRSAPRNRRRPAATAPPGTPRRHRCAAGPVLEDVVGVPGAQLREVPVDDVVPNPKQPRQVFDDEALEELTHSVREFGLLQPIVVRERAPTGRLRADHGRAPAARRPGRRAGDRAGDRPGHHGRRHAARRPAGEHPPGAAQPAGGGRGLPAAARGVRRHARGAGQQDRPQPLAGDQHHPADEAAGEGADPGRRRASSPPGTPARCSGCADAEAQDALATRIVAEGMSVRATEEAVAMAAAEQPRGQAPDPQDHRARRRGPRRPALRRLRDEGQGPDRPGQGPHRRRVRLGRRPAADHRGDGAGDHRTRSRSA